MADGNPGEEEENEQSDEEATSDSELDQRASQRMSPLVPSVRSGGSSGTRGTTAFQPPHGPLRLASKVHDASTSENGFVMQQALVFICLYVGYAMYIYNRRSFSFALPAVVTEESMTSYELGLIFSSQHLAYALSKLLAGFMSDRFSLSLMFTAGLFISGLFSLAFVDSESLMSFTATSFMNGIAQGFGWPPAAKILQQWFHPGQFGMWWGLLSTSMNVAAAVGHPIATFFAINHGWKVAIQMPAVLSMGVAVLVYIVLRNKPSDWGYPDYARTSKAASQHAGSQWSDLLLAPFTWLLAFSYMVVFCVRTSVQDWAQLYLVHDLGQPTYAASAFLGAVEIGGIVGTVSAGLASDLLMRSASWTRKPRRSARMILVYAMTAGIAGCLNLLIFSVNGMSSYYWIVTLGAMLGFNIYGAINLFGVVAMETAPPHLAGTAHAVISFFANVGGVLAGMPISIVAQYFEWFGAFVLLEVACMVIFLTMIVLKDMSATFLPYAPSISTDNDAKSK